MGKRIIISESEKLDIEKMYNLKPKGNHGDEIPYDELPEKLQKFVDEHGLTGKFYEVIFEDLENYRIVKGFKYVTDDLEANFLLDWIKIHKRKSNRITDCLGKKIPGFDYSWCMPTLTIQQIVLSN